MNTKPFLTIDKQIELLEQRGLLFQNKEAAKKDLLSYGYYEIINGYKDCFLANPLDSEDKFKAGITFEHIFQLFTLDKRDSPRKRTLTVVPLTSKNGTNRFSLGKEIFNQTLSFLNKQFDSMKLMQKELITKRENLNNALLDLREQTWLDDNGIIHVKDNKEFKVQNDKTDKQHDSFMAIQNKFTKEFFKLQKVTDMYQKYNKNSFVRLTDITTISKLRIHKINNYDPSGNICLTSQQMKAISDELMKLYISK